MKKFFAFLCWFAGLWFARKKPCFCNLLFLLSSAREVRFFLSAVSKNSHRDISARIRGSGGAILYSKVCLCKCTIEEVAIVRDGDGGCFSFTMADDKLSVVHMNGGETLYSPDLPMSEKQEIFLFMKELRKRLAEEMTKIKASAA